MVFTFETRYDTKALSVMARALRKTVRKKRSRRSHILGWIVIVLALLLLLADGFALDASTIITSLAALALLLVFLFEDRLNGAVAKKRLLPGTEKAVTVFSEDKFVSTTDVGKTEWNYDKILAVAETPTSLSSFSARTTGRCTTRGACRAARRTTSAASSRRPRESRCSGSHSVSTPIEGVEKESPSAESGAFVKQFQSRQ